MTGVFRAEFKERARRFSYLAMIALALFGAFWFVPRDDGSMQVMLIQPDRFIQAGNASWIPIASAWGLGFFLPLIGFFYLKNVLSDDVHNGLYSYIRTSPISKVQYVMGKWCAGVVLLYSITVVVILGALAMLPIHFSGEWLSLYDFFSPYAFLLTVIPLTVAIALLFDSIPLLRGALGSIIFIAGFVSMLTLQMFARDPSGPPLWFRVIDFSGSTTIVRTIQEAVLEQSGLPLDSLLFLGGPGINEYSPTQELVFHGTRFAVIDIIGLAGMLVVSFILVFLSSQIIAVSARIGIIQLPKPVKQKKRRIPENVGVPIYTSIVARRRGAALVQVKAEIGLLIAGQSKLWWMLALGGWIASMFSPVDIVQTIILPILLLWLVNVFSSMGSREHQHGFMQMVITSPAGSMMQSLSSWASGLLIAAVMSAPLFLRLVILGNWFGAFSCLSGVVFLPSFAFFLGEITKTRRVFEMLFIIISYCTLNELPALMYLGSPKNNSPVTAIVYLFLGVIFGICAVIKRQASSNDFKT